MFSLCGNIGANTGEILCDVSRGVGKRLYIFNGAIAPADYASQPIFEAKLAANAKLSKTASEKVFPFPEMQDIVDSSEANTEASLGLGFKTITKEGRPVYTLKVFAGNALVKELRKFNKKTVRILELDANGNMWGTKIGSNFVGYKAQLFVGGLKMATGAAVEEGVVTITLSILDTSEYNDNAYYMPVSNVTDIVGLLDISFEEVGAHAANVHTVRPFIPTSQIGQKIYLYDEYATELVDETLYEAFTGDDFTTPLDITSVAGVAGTKSFAVTFDNTDYTALAASSQIKLQLKAPEVLDAADVTGVESGYIILTK